MQRDRGKGIATREREKFLTFAHFRFLPGDSPFADLCEAQPETIGKVCYTQSGINWLEQVLNMTETFANIPFAQLHTDSTPAISAEGLGKTYSEGLIRRRRFDALKDVSFQVNPGEIFGLLGPNGAGKTTFIKILLGIIRKTTGSASLMGQPAGSQAGRRLTGYLPEHLRIPPHLNAYTALECYGNLSNVPTSVIRKKRDHLLELVGLASRAKDRCKKYSKGMLQRLGLAQTLLHEPKLLILDEPTDGLDPQARAEMRQIIKRLKNEGVTIFLNSHLLQEVELICERVAILDRGELKYCGSVSQIGDHVNSLADRIVEGIRLSLTLAGSSESIQAGLNQSDLNHSGLNSASVGLSGVRIESSGGEGLFQVSMEVENQEAVDLLVDQLRRNNVSIHRLLREQVSLEDAFLKLVSNQSSEEIVGARMDRLKK
jgi:ABC-2 type transport system ATP-binding protein